MYILYPYYCHGYEVSIHVPDFLYYTIHESYDEPCIHKSFHLGEIFLKLVHDSDNVRFVV